MNVKSWYHGDAGRNVVLQMLKRDGREGAWETGKTQFSKFLILFSSNYFPVFLACSRFEKFCWGFYTFDFNRGWQGPAYSDSQRLWTNGRWNDDDLYPQTKRRYSPFLRFPRCPHITLQTCWNQQQNIFTISRVHSWFFCWLTRYLLRGNRLFICM